MAAAVVVAAAMVVVGVAASEAAGAERVLFLWLRRIPNNFPFYKYHAFHSFVHRKQGNDKEKQAK
jgi:hypothetical protein